MGINLGSVLMNLGGLASTDSEQVSVSSITLFVTLLCICVVLGHLLEENRWINESVNALLIGLGTGAILLLATNGVSSRILEFNEEFFFIYLLPPIIFNAGFQVKKKHFFRNFMTIMLFGAVGTMISFCVISLGAKLAFDQLNMGYLELQDYLAIGAIFAATDSVCTLQVLNQDETPFLYSVVFGEGVVNDATSVVLFNAIQKFDLSEINSIMALKFFGSFFSLFISSTLLGVLMGLLSAYIIKKLYFGRICGIWSCIRDSFQAHQMKLIFRMSALLDSEKIMGEPTPGEGAKIAVYVVPVCLVLRTSAPNFRHSTDREVALMVLMAYLSYVMAELFNLSGILTVFFCGILMSHYTWHNVTESSRVTTKHVFATMSFIAETFIFLYVGMDALDLEKWKFASDSPGKSIGASAALFALVLAGRAAFVFPLSFLFNFTKKSKSDQLSLKQQVTIWWAGLIRGAVSMALAYNQFAKSGHTKQPGNALMITCTITVVLFSTVVFGLLTKHLVRFLFDPSNNPNDTVPSEPSSPTSLALPLIHNGEGSEANGTSSRNVGRPSSLQMLLSAPSHTVHYYWRKFDNAFMRPVFGGRGFGEFVPGTPREESDGQ